MSNEMKPIKKTSFLLILIVAVMLILSLMALYTALEIYLQGGEETLIYYATIGVLGVGISIYMLMLSRRKIPLIMLNEQRVNTFLVCEKCNFKSIREFKRGDYIFKESDECPKCKEKMLITAIYRESKEKEKEWKF